MALEVRLTIPRAHDAPVLCCTFHPQRRWLFTGGEDNEIRMWEVETGARKGTLSGHTGWVTGLVFWPAARVLFSCSTDGRLFVWDFKAHPPDVVEIEKVGAPLYSMTVDRRLNRLIVGGRSIVRWYFINDALTRENTTYLRPWTSVRAHGEVICGICATETKVFSGGHDGGIMMYEASNPKSNAVHTTVHKGAISSLTIAFDDDNKWVATGSFDRSVCICSPHDLKLLQRFSGFTNTITGMCYVPQTRCLWVACGEKCPYVMDVRMTLNITKYVCGEWDTRSPRLDKLFYVEGMNEVIATSTSHSLLFLRYNPGAHSALIPAHTEWETLFYCVKNNIVELFCAGEEAVVSKWTQFSTLNTYLYMCQKEYIAHKRKVLCITQCPELDLLVTASEDGVINVWNQDLGGVAVAGGTDAEADFLSAGNKDQLLYQFDEHRDRVVGLSCHGKTLISVSWDRSLRFWDLDAGKHLFTHPDGHDGVVRGLESVPARGVFGTYSEDGNLHVWDASQRSLKIRMKSPGDVFHARWNPVREEWITATEFVCLIWSFTGECLRKFSCGRPVTALCVDLTQGDIMVATNECVFRVHSALTGEVKQMRTGHKDTIKALLHIPEANHYVSASTDRTIRIWKAHAEDNQEDSGGGSGDAPPDCGIEAGFVSFADKYPLTGPKFLQEDAGTGPSRMGGNVVLDYGGFAERFGLGNKKQGSGSPQDANNEDSERF